MEPWCGSRPTENTSKAYYIIYVTTKRYLLSYTYHHKEETTCAVRPEVSQAFPAKKSCRWAAFFYILGGRGGGPALTTSIYSRAHAESQSENDQSLSSLSLSIVYCSIAIREAILRSEIKCLPEIGEADVRTQPVRDRVALSSKHDVLAIIKLTIPT